MKHLSKIWKVSDEGWWIVLITLHPRLQRRFNVRTTLYAELESSPEVGSSRKRIFGFVMSSTPIDTRRFSPPEIPRISSFPIRLSAQLSRSRSFRILSTKTSRFCSDRFPGSLIFAENVRASLGVCVGYSASSCITKAILLRKSTGSISSPSAVTTPCQGRLCRPARVVISVVFPEPLGPIMQDILPFSIFPFAWSRMRRFFWSPVFPVAGMSTTRSAH
mmetsp:Transcript_22804/g.55376  ORF Transcript_22804/g.55376 Transcript_22804/m.55376 type:complete len:219 (+) Transcript_22804:1391-2047(+)